MQTSTKQTEAKYTKIKTTAGICHASFFLTKSGKALQFYARGQTRYIPASVVVNGELAAWAEKKIGSASIMVELAKVQAEYTSAGVETVTGECTGCGGPLEASGELCEACCERRDS